MATDLGRSGKFSSVPKLPQKTAGGKKGMAKVMIWLMKIFPLHPLNSALDF